MDRLIWDESSLIGITEAVPEVAEYETHHRFEFSRGNKKCVIQVWQLESFIEILISEINSHSDTVKVSFYCRSGCVIDEDLQRVSFKDCVFAESRFSYLEVGRSFEKGHNPYGNEVGLLISGVNIYLEVV